jgi:hypothetical protein
MLVERVGNCRRDTFFVCGRGQLSASWLTCGYGGGRRTRPRLLAVGCQLTFTQGISPRQIPTQDNKTVGGRRWDKAQVSWLASIFIPFHVLFRYTSWGGATVASDVARPMGHGRARCPLLAHASWYGLRSTLQLPVELGTSAGERAGVREQVAGAQSARRGAFRQRAGTSAICNRLRPHQLTWSAWRLAAISASALSPFWRSFSLL